MNSRFLAGHLSIASRLLPVGRTNARGLTLLELLVVVFLVSALALATVSLTDDFDSQSRHNDTRARLEQIRKASAGRPSLSVNGQPLVSGYVADVGRLPNSVRDLLEQGTLSTWAYDPGLKLWSGWRGPYLEALPGNDAFRDGWGNPDQSGAGGADNFGWTFAPNQADGELFVQSLGRDGKVGGADYDADFPGASELLLRSTDHQVNLKGWKVTVRFDNPLGGIVTLPSADQSLRVRIYYPLDGSLNWPATWPATPLERDASAYLSLSKTLAQNAVSDGETLDVTFDFGVTDKFVPWGIRSLVVVKDADGAEFPVIGQAKLVTLVPRITLAPIASSNSDPFIWRLE